MLKVMEIELKGSELFSPSIVPNIYNFSADFELNCDASIPVEEKKDFFKGFTHTSLPYKQQNNYEREQKKIKQKVAILENDHLKAVFLLNQGGRLWQLYDKKLKRDIVYCNDVFRLANLAVRNAWFAGGVEWNYGVKGHSPITCDRMFAQHLRAKNGQDILKMYEYESISKSVYALYITLCDDELVVRVEAENPNDHPVYTYWWSNIAVSQTKGTRVFVPADKAFVTGYRDGANLLSKMDTPMIDGRDISFSKNAIDAVDYFYDIPKENKKWIASVEDDGIGLLHSSSDILKGRKTFLWGTLPGCKHWNSWLTEGRDYLEIQAGLQKTQFEMRLMDAHEKISWNESYKAVCIDPSLQSGDYDKATEVINGIVNNPDCKASIFEGAETIETLNYGSGRGALHEIAIGRKMSDNLEFFRESLTEEERYFKDLLEGKDSGDYKVSYTNDREWIDIIKRKKELSAYDWYMIGIIEYSSKNLEKAEECFYKSIEVKREYYALVALSLYVAAFKNDLKTAYSLAKEARDMRVGDLDIALMYARAALAAGEYAEFIEFWEKSAENVHSHGRMKMYAGQCYVNLNKLQEAKQLINKNLQVADIREGEYSFSKIWQRLYKKQMAVDSGVSEEAISDEEVLEKYPLPYEIDFEMK